MRLIDSNTLYISSLQPVEVVRECPMTEPHNWQLTNHVTRHDRPRLHYDVITVNKKNCAFHDIYDGSDLVISYWGW